jgi:hypothetical protein
VAYIHGSIGSLQLLGLGGDSWLTFFAFNATPMPSGKVLGKKLKFPELKPK